VNQTPVVTAGYPDGVVIGCRTASMSVLPHDPRRRFDLSNPLAVGVGCVSCTWRHAVRAVETRSRNELWVCHVLRGPVAILTRPIAAVAYTLGACRGGSVGHTVQPMPDSPSDPNPVDQPLTPRELEVVALVVGGLSNRAIADRLFLSTRTVQAHLANAMERTATSSRTQLAVYVLRRGLVPLDPAEPDKSDPSRTFRRPTVGEHVRRFRPRVAHA
jgi:DNA-binding CsgD family transcriptional regulator